MKILFLSSHPAVSLQDSQGYAIRIAELIRALRELGHDVQPLIAGDEAGRRSAQRLYRGSIKQLLPRPLAQVLRELSFVALDAQFYRRVLPAVSAWEPDAIIERFSFFNRSGMRLSRALNIPLLLDDISPTFEEEIYFQRALRRLAGRIQQQVFAQADGLVAVSSPIKAHLITLGVPPAKIHLVHNGVDCRRFSPEVDGTAVRQKYGLAERLVVGFVGGFLPWQGIELLLDIALEEAERLPELRFLLVGPTQHTADLAGDLQQKVEAASQSGRVVFTGPLPHDEIPQHLAAMDIVTVPDFNPYGNPIKIFEYMGMGKPLIAPRVPSIAEIVTHNRDGWLMPERGREPLVAALQMLGADGALRQRLGATARQTALERFTWRSSAAQLVDLLERARQRPFQAREPLLERLGGELS